MFASAVLTSRLPPNEEPWSPLTPNTAAFADMTLAVTLFVLLPFMRRDVRRRSRPGHLALTALLHLAAIASLLALNGSGLEASTDDAGDSTRGSRLAAWYGGAVVGIAVISPAWLVRMMGFKEQINGPWDEAKPDASLL